MVYIATWTGLSVKMNINELHQILKQKFTPERGFGVIKLENNPEWENIHFLIPPPPPTSLDPKNLPYALISEANKILSSLPSYSQMSEIDKLVQYLFIRREVVQSSRMEGTWSTVDHALTPGDIADENEGKNEHQAVRSYANLLEEIISETVQKKESVFTVELLCHIHKKIIENDPKSKGIPGKIRTEGEPGSIVTVGGQRKEDSIYNPATAKEVLRCLKQLLDWLADRELAQIGDAGAGLSLPVRLAIVHSHFEAIHPFTDGNGRTGRALWPLQMVCSGNMPIYLSGYVEERKKDYISSLEEAQKRLNYSPLIEFICHAIIESNDEAKKTKETIEQLEKNWQKRTKFRENSSAKKSLNLILANPIITSAFLEKKLGVKSTAADDTIKKLLQHKIIRFRKSENRQKIYAAEEVIQILSRPFGSEIDLALEKANHLLNLD